MTEPAAGVNGKRVPRIVISGKTDNPKDTPEHRKPQAGRPKEDATTCHRQAKRLARRIHEFWAARGLAVHAWVEEGELYGELLFYSVRSNLSEVMGFSSPAPVDTGGVLNGRGFVPRSSLVSSLYSKGRRA